MIIMHIKEGERHLWHCQMNVKSFERKIQTEKDIIEGANCQQRSLQTTLYYDDNNNAASAQQIDVSMRKIQAEKCAAVQSSSR